MQLTNFKLLLTALFLLAGLNLHAQSLGNPVLFEDFGRAASVYQTSGPPLAPGVTTLTSTGTRCPGDGSYSLVTSTDNCFSNTWITVNKDYGSIDAFGFMMIINASNQPSVFYTQRVAADLMCPGSAYEFSVMITNVLRPTTNTNFVRPNIRFTVTKADGTLIDNSYTTGEVPETEAATWKKYAIRFDAPTDGQGIIVKLSNEVAGSLGNDFAMDDISVSPYGNLINAGFGTPTGDKEKGLCVGQGVVNYTLNADASTYTNPRYQWQISTNNGNWQNIAGATNANVNISVPDAAGKYSYRVGVLGGVATSANCQIFSDPLVVSRFPVPVFTLPPTTTVCQGETLMFNADRGTSYQWTGPNGYTSTDQNPLVSSSATANLAGEYRVIVTKDGCSTTATTNVIVAPPLTVAVNNRTPQVCEGDTYQMVASGGTTYRWLPATGLSNPNIANPVVTPTSDIEYQVYIGNGGCEKTETVNITVIKKPTVSAGPDRTMAETEPITLNTSITGNYESFYWTPTTYIQDPRLLTPTVNPPEDITYTLHVLQANGCGETTDDVAIRVYKKISLPNTFSPNGDGVNDFWRIAKLASYPNSELTIFTRNGQQVFRTIGDARQWNGQYNGKELPAGVYYYVIDLKDNLPKRSGWVMLIR